SSLTIQQPPTSTLFPYTTLFRSLKHRASYRSRCPAMRAGPCFCSGFRIIRQAAAHAREATLRATATPRSERAPYSSAQGRCEDRSEEHTSELRHEWISYAVFCLK